MSDKDLEKAAENVILIERAAHNLSMALLESGDKAFFKVHPHAIDIANEYLLDCGYELTKIKKGK